VPSQRADGAAFVLDAIKQGFANPLDGVLGILLLVFLVGLVGLIAFIYALRQRKETLENLDDPKLLFDDLAIAHGLSAEEKSLIAEIAHRQKPPHPEFAFVLPDFWGGLESHPKHALLAKLKEKLIGSGETTATHPQSPG
jgi:hypothetical protein